MCADAVLARFGDGLDLTTLEGAYVVREAAHRLGNAGTANGRPRMSSYLDLAALDRVLDEIDNYAGSSFGLVDAIDAITTAMVVVIALGGGA
jgi:hypothetical protein